MEWLNYHHLLYFWSVAREGSLRAASEKLGVSQPSMSAQIQALEGSLGQPLFQRSGRNKILTDAGQTVFSYADEIFALGGELMSNIKGQLPTRARRLHVGVADSFPKLTASEILRPLLEQPAPMQVICREGKVDDLLAQLAVHRLDVVLADEPASSSHQVRAHNHLLGRCGMTFCATEELALLHRRNFPKSLHGAPALLPTENTSIRRSLEKWFHSKRVKPSVIAEFDDAALMKIMACEGHGIVAIPTAMVADAIKRYDFSKIGEAPGCYVEFYAITAERHIEHPGVIRIAEQAQRKLVQEPGRRAASSKKNSGSPNEKAPKRRS